MKVSGFTFLRNAVKNNYPFIASINSILPIVDEFIVVVCDSEDNTLELVKSINSNKLKVISAPFVSNEDWTYARYTNLAYFLCRGDWCFYIQADEVFPEWELDKIYRCMEKFLKVKEVEGILLNYRHFYGSFRYIRIDRGWYYKEVRIIRNNLNIVSYKDAQGFRLVEGSNFRKLMVVDSDTYIHHYGFVFKKLGDRIYKECKKEWLREYTGKHPSVLGKYIEDFEDNFDINKCNLEPNFENLIKLSKEFFDKLLGKRFFEYKPYKLMKP
ncbi:MAG: glycosyltransferase family 2 protein [candidate division WOR-3 bacterium]|nr:glycosyltransferase family 2 protein [candidate division WOR-3 bacterium]MDW8150045.1 glycosyltransferase family 2 protein [candidate division WOR-3 bacterium]